MTSPSERIVVLVTSDLYKNDILNLLCLERGMKYRFRYRQEWIPTELLTKTDDLVGKKGVVIFLDDARKEFFPILNVTIDKVEKLGDVFYFEFTIGELVRYETQSNRTNEQHSATRRYIPEEYFDSKTGKLEKYVFLKDVQISETGPSDELAVWAGVLHSIWSIHPFENSIFLKILKITDSKGNLTRPGEVSLRTKERGYVLKSHEIYTLEILQRARNDFPAFNSFKLDLVFMNDHVTPIKASEMIVGKYDKLQLMFMTKWRKSEVRSVIGLKSNVGDGFDTPEVYIPLKIKKNTGRLVGSVATILVGITIAVGSGYVSQLLQVPGIAASLLGVLGTVLFALGVAWLRPMYE